MTDMTPIQLLERWQRQRRVLIWLRRQHRDYAETVARLRLTRSVTRV